MSTCDTFWGSHGCELRTGHDPEQEHPIHECSIAELDDDGKVTDRWVCSQAQYVDDGHVRMRFLSANDEWSDWNELALPLFRNDEEKVR